MFFFRLMICKASPFELVETVHILLKLYFYLCPSYTLWNEAKFRVSPVDGRKGVVEVCTTSSMMTEKSQHTEEIELYIVDCFQYVMASCKLAIGKGCIHWKNFYMNCYWYIQNAWKHTKFTKLFITLVTEGLRKKIFFPMAGISLRDY